MQQQAMTVLFLIKKNKLNSKGICHIHYNRGLEAITISSSLNITGVRLYSLSGQELKAFNYNPETIKANTLSAGVYIIQIDSNQGREIKKIIKH